MRPVLFEIFGYGIPGYGVMAAAGIVAGLIVSALLARRAGIGADFVLDAVFWMAIAGFAGARALYLCVTWRATLNDPLGSLISGGGGVFIGGMAAGAAMLWVMCKRLSVGFLRMADIFAPGLSLAHVFGRIGCLLAGCCYGAVAPRWAAGCAISFPRITGARGQIIGSWPFLDEMSRGWIAPDAACSLPLWPVQIIEAVLNLALFCALMLLWRRRMASGRIFAAYIAGYAFLRFGVEFLRGDADRGIIAGLSLSQWLCVAALGAAAWIWRRTTVAQSPTADC
ncbi:MAG: prolipoprotein diacylglyceryl transferase family protein [bacterium]|nr:prolipoprotein diacylglyceryl transferase [Candidatus Sumerlaeota bacterium]